jgi:hypothetical protein
MKNLLSLTSFLALFASMLLANTVASRDVDAQPISSSATNASLGEEVKITSPTENSTVPSGDLVIEGVSSDTADKDCHVSVDWNDQKPMQNVTAAGPGGPNDYSNWTFTYTQDYHVISPGVNELTSKISCPGSGNSNNITSGIPEGIKKYYSVNVTGVDNGKSVNDEGKNAIVTPSSFNHLTESPKTTFNSQFATSFQSVSSKSPLPQYSNATSNLTQALVYNGTTLAYSNLTLNASGANHNNSQLIAQAQLIKVNEDHNGNDNNIDQHDGDKSTDSDHSPRQ